MVLKIIRYVSIVLKCAAGKRWIDFSRNEVLHRDDEKENNLHII